jgi:hypothetical protein
VPYGLECASPDSGQSGPAPNGPPASSHAEPVDHDALVESVRSWALFRLKETSLRDLEQESSVAKSSIDKFVKRQALPSKIWPKLRLWFLRDRRARYASLQEPEEMALLMMESLANLPDDRRAEAIASTAEHYEALHRRAHAPTPEWIAALRGLAREGAMPPGPTVSHEYPVPRRRGRKKKLPEPPRGPQAPGEDESDG